MTKLEEQINKIKRSLNDLIKGDSDKEFIESVTSIDKDLDQLAETGSAMAKETAEVKESLLKVVKTTSFKPTGHEEDDTSLPQEPKSLDEIIAEQAKAYEKKGN